MSVVGGFRLVAEEGFRSQSDTHHVTSSENCDAVVSHFLK